jgi:hypothetical protein
LNEIKMLLRRLSNGSWFYKIEWFVQKFWIY